MARVYNITSASFDPAGAPADQALGAPVNARIAVQGEVVDDSTGLDLFVSINRLARRKVVIQIAFNDHDDMQVLQGDTYLGAAGVLVIKAPNTASPPVDQIGTIADALLTEVIGDAQHAEFGSHIATFEAIASGGAASPLVWT